MSTSDSSMGGHADQKSRTLSSALIAAERGLGRERGI
jgi:hypothetical protein